MHEADHTTSCRQALHNRARHQECLRTLLAAGASHRLTDRQGTTPLQLAKSRGYREMVQMLEQSGAR